VTSIFLVRHAMTVWHTEGRYAGKSDVGLAPEGYTQADRLAEAEVAKKYRRDGVSA
jgi:broad specificity phosphatase PhoE